MRPSEEDYDIVGMRDWYPAAAIELPDDPWFELASLPDELDLDVDLAMVVLASNDADLEIDDECDYEYDDDPYCDYGGGD